MKQCRLLFVAAILIISHQGSHGFTTVSVGWIVKKSKSSHSFTKRGSANSCPNNSAYFLLNATSDDSRKSKHQVRKEKSKDSIESNKPQYRSNLQRTIQASRAVEATTTRRRIERRSENKSINGSSDKRIPTSKDQEVIENANTSISDTDDNVMQAQDTVTAKDHFPVPGQEQKEDEVNSPAVMTNEEYSIDSFLMGEYDRPFAEDAAAPHPGLNPRETVENALYALRNLDVPEVSHGAAVFLRFCAPLSRSDRWGGSVSGKRSEWKEMMRGALTPTMTSRRIRTSEQFSVLLDWERMDTTDGFSPEHRMGSTVAFVNCSLFFGMGDPVIIQFSLLRINEVWLIDSAVVSKKEWFYGE
eukprot:374837_1